MDLLLTFIDWVLHVEKHLLVFIDNYGTWVYALLFLIIFCETGLVFMPFLPGDSLLFVVGVLCGSGHMSLEIVCPLLIAAAFIGDNTNYWIGRKFGLTKLNRLIKPTHLQKAESFYQKHGGKTVLLARFAPIVRTIAPFVAGLGKMPYNRFMAFSIAGGILWVGCLTILGYYFGGLPWIRDNLTVVGIVIVLLSLLPAMITALHSRFFRS